MLIGYARVSKSEQDTMLQLDAMQRAGVERVYQEQRSGAGVRRPRLERMLEDLRAGDVVVVYKLDRLGRSLVDLLHILDRIERVGASFRSLTEPVDTSSLAGRMLMQMLGSFAEFERGMIRERSIAGQQAARDRGVHCGRRTALTAAEGAKAAERYLTGQATLTGLARLYGCHISSIKRAIARATSQQPRVSPHAVVDETPPSTGEKKPAEAGYD